MSIWSGYGPGAAVPVWHVVSRGGQLIVQDEAWDAVNYREDDAEATLDVDVAFTDYHDGVRLTFDSSDGGMRDDYDIFQVILPAGVARRLGLALIGEES